MGKYNKGKFTITTLPRRLLQYIDRLKRRGESRADVIQRLIECYLNKDEIVKTPNLVQELDDLIFLPTPNLVYGVRKVIGAW